MHGFFDLLNNSIIPDTLPRGRNVINITVFFLSLAAAFLYVARSKRNPLPKDKISFLLISYLVLFFLSCFIPDSGSFDPSHVIILMPIIQIVQALFYSLLIIFLGKKLWVYLIIVFLLANHAYSEITTMNTALTTLKEEMDIVGISPTKHLTEYLEGKGITEIFCFDNPLLAVIDFLSELRITTWGFNVCEGDFWDHPTKISRIPDHIKVSFESVYEYQLKQMNPFYFVRSTNNEFSEKGFQVLKKLAERDNKDLILLETFTNKSKNVCLELYRVRDRVTNNF